MSAKVKRDKTALFQAFEAELRASSSKLGARDLTLNEAESVLYPFFENISLLRKALGAGALTYEANFLSSKKTEPWVIDCVNTLLGEFRTARSVNEKACFETWVAWMNVTNRAISNVASTAQLQGNKDGLEAHLLVRSYMRDAADLLEGTLQSFARLRLKMLELAGSVRKSSKQIEELSFGEVIDELMNIKRSSAMYQPQPFGISLSQWRNIANHNSYETNGNQVTCTYGPTGRRKSFVCTPSDIASVARYANDLGFAHKVGIEIFGIDNLEKLGQRTPQIPLTDYTKDSALAYGLVAARFCISQVIEDLGVWHLTLRDELGRNKELAKAALQEACVSHALMCDGCHIEAVVHSQNSTYRFGFKASFANKGEAFPKDFRVSVRKLDENFRIKSD
ncbi:MAG: hypothetical protein EB141_01240 [Verrucomicrobia bacterium]|nr:hypothetical protein [Verrucomicrobiota bacterium]NBU08118.1 hypothetical protein [Pseudomonadota bacterium]NDA66127.1 hypothetical protein [Verrucomicrobiota bacterium]NDB74268.1 hypothetical protein [Verrucomicrobiota bacterium]NDD36872.1 hypothetical protein [Verrucomicrobiota bacterium]